MKSLRQVDILLQCVIANLAYNKIASNKRHPKLKTLESHNHYSAGLKVLKGKRLYKDGKSFANVEKLNAEQSLSTIEIRRLLLILGM